MSWKISDLIEDPRTADEVKEDMAEVADPQQAGHWRPGHVEDATCHTEVMYQLISKVRQMCDQVLQEMNEERSRAYHKDEEFVMVAGSLAGVDGHALTSALVNVINELAIVDGYEYWLEEHKEPRPGDVPKPPAFDYREEYDSLSEWLSRKHPQVYADYKMGR